jgi:hypothetical protein
MSILQYPANIIICHLDLPLDSFQYCLIIHVTILVALECETPNHLHLLPTLQLQTLQAKNVPFGGTFHPQDYLSYLLK